MERTRIPNRVTTISLLPPLFTFGSKLEMLYSSPGNQVGYKILILIRHVEQRQYSNFTFSFLLGLRSKYCYQYPTVGLRNN